MQYDYALHVLSGENSVFDENTASWVSNGDSLFVFKCNCRHEKGDGSKVVTADGEVYQYGATIYCPKGTTGINPGDEIKVLDVKGNLMISGVVRSVDPRKFNTRLWV